MLEIVKRFVRDRVVVDDETKRIDIFLSPYWSEAARARTQPRHGDLDIVIGVSHHRGPVNVKSITASEASTTTGSRLLLHCGVTWQHHTRHHYGADYCSAPT